MGHGFVKFMRRGMKKAHVA